MTEWVFYVAEVTTGQIVADLPLATFTGGRSLTGGSMSATLPVAHLPVDLRRQYVDFTAPGRYSVIAERDGVVAGEWVIWKRSRSNDEKPLTLTGNEVVSLLDRRVMGGWTWTGVEQLEIARQLVVEGFAGAGDPLTRPGGVLVTVPAITPSGQLRDRTYKQLDGTIGQRLKELSEVQGGFDYLIDTTRTGQLVTRTARFHYPRAGIDLPYVFESGSAGYPQGNVTAITLSEDGTTLASKAHAIGSTSGDVALVGGFQDLALVTAGWPYLERTQTWSDVTVQATIDSYAHSLWQDSQSAEQPITLSVLADAFPTCGDYALGDRLAFRIEPSGNFPDGYTGTIRVIGWTHQPGVGPETLTLSIMKES